MAVIAGSAGLPHANAAPETRTISLHHVHTSEDLTITYKKNGQYDEDALKKINWILRDWRKNDATKMDPSEIDLLWEVYQEVGAKEPIYIVCGYRSPATNEMLRSRSRHSGVARFSQHTLGKAIDFYIPGVPLDQLRATAMKLQGGGVGYYPTSGSPFVHLDVGNVRAWPRMSRQQLVKLFPNGRTVHVPADGSPLPGYQLALADLERGHRTAASPKKRTLLAALFGTPQDAEESDDNASARQVSAPPARRGIAAAMPATIEAPEAKLAVPVTAPLPRPAPTRTVVASAAPELTPEPVPLPRGRPIYQLASAESRFVPVPARRPAGSVNVASLSANDVISSRGFWDAVAEPQRETPAASMTTARRAVTTGLSDGESRDTTATVGPFARADRVPPELALAYAAQAEAGPSATSPPRLTSLPATIVRRGSASVAVKPTEISTRSNTARIGDPLNDPWLRGLTLVASVHESMTVTRFGDPDYSELAEFMRKPTSSVMMTFSSDPHLGMTDKGFSGSAVVFQATVTFAGQRTASLH